MICPIDMTQMRQKDGIGGGEATDRRYETWEVKECPICGRIVREYYLAEVISASQAERLKQEVEIIYLWKEE